MEVLPLPQESSTNRSYSETKWEIVTVDDSVDEETPTQSTPTKFPSNKPDFSIDLTTEDIMNQSLKERSGPDFDPRLLKDLIVEEVTSPFKALQYKEMNVRMYALGKKIFACHYNINALKEVAKNTLSNDHASIDPPPQTTHVPVEPHVLFRNNTTSVESNEKDNTILSENQIPIAHIEEVDAESTLKSNKSLCRAPINEYEKHTPATLFNSLPKKSTLQEKMSLKQNVTAGKRKTRFSPMSNHENIVHIPNSLDKETNQSESTHLKGSEMMNETIAKTARTKKRRKRINEDRPYKAWIPKSERLNEGNHQQLVCVTSIIFVMCLVLILYISMQ